MPELDDSASLGDPSFDRYARLVRTVLEVPVALVSIVETDRQVFIGQQGLPAPLDDERTTGLSSSICQFVVADSAPLILPDTRRSDRLVGNGAVDDLKVLAYAGYPLTDGTGVVVGSLCAIDYETRDWDPAKLTVLEDLAAACSAELELRVQSRTLAQLSTALQAAGDTTQLLLSLSEDLARTRTLADVAAALHDIAIHRLGALRAGVWVVSGLEARQVEHAGSPFPAANAALPLVPDNPVGAAVLGAVPGHFPADKDADAYVDDDAVRGALVLAGRGQPDGEARVFLPLSVAGEALGCLDIVWSDTREFEQRNRSVLRALSAYTAQAVHRAVLLEERVSVATTLQNAMLSRLPRVPGLDLAARYRTAGDTEKVGGDWYDVITRRDGGVALVIGDVVGHDIAAAAVMGQLRNLLRAFVWDGSGGPAEVMGRLDRAARDLEIGAMATSALLVLEVDHDGAGRPLVWTNAGHPAPVLIGADGTVSSLDSDHTDCLLGVVPDAARTDHRVVLAPGSTILLFTDGLIESRACDLDAGRALLLAAAARHHRLPVVDLVDAVLADLLEDHQPDDVAVLAVRITAASSARA